MIKALLFTLLFASSAAAQSITAPWPDISHVLVENEDVAVLGPGGNGDQHMIRAFCLPDPYNSGWKLFPPCAYEWPVRWVVQITAYIDDDGNEVHPDFLERYDVSGGLVISCTTSAYSITTNPYTWPGPEPGADVYAWWQTFNQDGDALRWHQDPTYPNSLWVEMDQYKYWIEWYRNRVVGQGRLQPKLFLRRKHDDGTLGQYYGVLTTGIYHEWDCGRIGQQ